MSVLCFYMFPESDMFYVSEEGFEVALWSRKAVPCLLRSSPVKSLRCLVARGTGTPLLRLSVIRALRYH